MCDIGFFNSCCKEIQEFYVPLIAPFPSEWNSLVILSLSLQVCDEPHPLLVKDMLAHCTNGDIDEAYKIMSHLWRMGYSAVDIITNIFRVCKNMEMAEYLKLEFIKVSFLVLFIFSLTFLSFLVISRIEFF